MFKKYIKKLKSFANKTGSTIIELLIAVMVVGLIVTAVANVVTNSIKNTGESRYRQNATILGQQVIEHLRGQKNELGMVNFKKMFEDDGGSKYCYSDFNNILNTACGDANVVNIGGTDFKRDVEIYYGGSGTRVDQYYVNVRVRVSWMDSNSTRDIELIQEFKQDSGFTN